MTGSAPWRQPRPLFVVSNDYGELGLAMFFLQGLDLSHRAALALPERLHPGHRDLLPGATHRYGSVDDLLALADDHDADVVLLFSGYLLSNNQLLAPAAVDELVRRLHERGCVVITTDPFLGLASEVSRDDVRFDVPVKPWLKLLLRRQERRFVKDLVRTAEILQPVVHLYCAAPAAWTSARPSPSTAFFNPRLRDPGPEPDDQRWVFILGAEDARWGVFSDHALTRNGDPWLDARRKPPTGARRLSTGSRRVPFVQQITSLLEQTAAANRIPTLIAPPEIVDALPQHVADRCELVPFCPFPAFMQHVLRAEYVFYWNAISASMLPRLALNRPIFLFDRGHMSRLLPALYDLAVDLHFGGKPPAYLDPQIPLDPAELADHWANHGLGDRDVLEKRYRESIDPERLLDLLVKGGTVGEAPDTFEDDLQRGRQLSNEGRWREAIVPLGRAVDARPEDPESHRLLADAATATADWSQSAEHHRRLIELGAADGRVVLGFGRALTELGEHELAHHAYQAAAQLDLGDVDLLLDLASRLASAGADDETLGVLESAALLAPDDARVHVAHGDALCTAGRTAEAAIPIQRAIDLGAATPLRYMRLARAHATASDFEAAARAYQKAAAMVPTWSALQRRVGDLSAARRRWKEAAAHYLTALGSSGGGHEAALNGAGDLRARRIHNLVSIPARLPAYVELARLLDAAGRTEEAEVVREAMTNLKARLGDPIRIDRLPPEHRRVCDDTLARYRGRRVEVLAVGIHSAETLLEWKHSFDDAKILGLDANPPRIEDATGRLRVLRANLENAALLKTVAEKAGRNGFDVIVDDAPTRGDVVRRTFELLFHHHLRPGGVYVIEDWQSCMRPTGDENREAQTTKEAETGRSSSVEAPMQGLVSELVRSSEAFESVLVAGNRVLVFKKAPRQDSESGVWARSR